MKLKQLVEAITNRYCFGCYEDEAFGNASSISSIKGMSKEIGNYVERSPDTENEQWHVRYIAFTMRSFITLIDVMKTGIDEGWYSLLWNDKDIYVIFSNGMVHLINSGGDALNPRAASTNNAMTLLQRNGLTQEYLDFHLNKAFEKFKQIKL